MLEEEKIQALLSSRTSENNHLAIELMRNLLNYSFEEAFIKLQLADWGNYTYGIEIQHIRIIYKVELQQMIYVPATFADIYRKIYYRNKMEPASDIKIIAEEESVFNLGPNPEPRELPEIRHDLMKIIPHIAALYTLMEQGG